jgi:hypothetical protein
MKNNEYYKKTQAKYRIRKKTKITELITLFSNIKDILKDSNLTAEQKISNIKDLFL